MSVADPVDHCVLICLLEVRQTREVEDPLSFGTVISSVSYDGVGFAKMHAAIETDKLDADDSSVAACDPYIFVRLFWRGVMVFGVPTSTPLLLLIMSMIVTKVRLVLFLVAVLLTTRRQIWL